MSWRPHGRAFTGVSSPTAFAVCDRCGFYYNRTDLRFQYDYVGPRLQNLRLLVCDKCYDDPFIHNIPIVVPPDPVPVMNPRPDVYALAMANPLYIKDDNLETITDTSAAPILGTYDGTQNVPPYPFVGFTMLRADGGGKVQMTVVRDDAYAVTSTQQPQVQKRNANGTPAFKTTLPTTPPNHAYNNLNNTTDNSGQVPNQYAWPVILTFED